jgi:putative FmdB family regulatory protein
MPLYEYFCEKCAAPFEVLRPMSQSGSPIACPHCAAAGARRMISVFSAVSKDSGGSSRMVAGSQTGGGCGSCGGGHCATCGH